MKRKWLFFVAPLAIAAFVWIGGELVMHLWNWLLPALFGWRMITFWQAIGLLVLCRILIGGWGGSGSPGRHRARKHGRWEHLTPEEHEHFREWMRTRGIGTGAAPSGPGATA